MKLRESLVLMLVLSLSIVPVLSQSQVGAQNQYSEKIDVYTLGTNAYTFVTLNAFNSSNSAALTSVESTSGLNGYRLVALSGQDYNSDLIALGPDGYNVLNVPFVPTNGVFLMVNASSASAAVPVVSYFNSLLGTNLTLTSTNSSSASFTYDGLVSFTGVAAPALYKFVPSREGGFASILGESTLTGLPLPTITLLGVRSGSGFEHSVILGAASKGAISAGGTLSVEKALGGASNITASSNSTSSQFVVHSLDGLLSSTDSKASVSTTSAAFSGLYSLTVPAGQQLKPNVTIDSTPPTLNAYRTVSLSYRSGVEYVGVTVWLSNTAQNATSQETVVQNVTVNDDWWKAMPNVFQLATSSSTSSTTSTSTASSTSTGEGTSATSGTSTASATTSGGAYNETFPQIVAGQNATFTYSLKVLTSTPMEVVVPAAPADYSFMAAGKALHEHVLLNQVDLQLNNNSEPGMNIFVQPDYGHLSGSGLGSNASIWVTVSNQGLAPASDIKVGNKTIPDVPAGTTAAPFSIAVPFTSFQQRNVSERFTLQWTTPTQQTENITSNSLALVLSHSEMVVPFIQVQANGTITAQTLSSRALNVTYTFTDHGTPASGPVTASQTLPAGVTCSVLSNANGTGNVNCGAGQVTFSFSRIEPGKSKSVELSLNFTQNDYIFPAASVVTSYGSAALRFYGQGYALPAGLVATKSFSPNIVFPGMKPVVTVGLTNNGSQTLYNVSLSSAPDSFDSFLNSTALKTFASVGPHQTVNFTYGVTVSPSSSGNLSAAPVSASFLIGGVSQSLSLGKANLLVYKPLTLSASASPSSPTAGKDFTITFTVKNDAPTQVSNVNFNWTLPSGVSLVKGGQSAGRLVTESIPSVGANSSDTIALTLTADIGLTMDTGTSHLSYQYQGSTLKGTVSSDHITVVENVTAGYAVPIVIAVLIALAALVYIHRSARPVTSPARNDS